MRYFLDNEFLEGAQKTFFSKSKPTIDLISIGLVAEDNRTYYAISKDFNLKEAWNRWEDIDSDGSEANLEFKIGDKRRYRKYWIRDNVLRPIFNELLTKEKTKYKDFNRHHLEYLIDKHGKTNKQIAEDIKKFVNVDFHTFCNFNGEAALNILEGKTHVAEEIYNSFNYTNPKFYAYYADYDWVVFCWLFGKMINLPKGFPMYCIDLKQILDDKAKTMFPLSSLEDGIRAIKSSPKGNYPEQNNEHHALSDALWTKELYKFLNKL